MGKKQTDPNLASAAESAARPGCTREHAGAGRGAFIDANANGELIGIASIVRATKRPSPLKDDQGNERFGVNLVLAAGGVRELVIVEDFDRAAAVWKILQGLRADK